MSTKARERDSYYLLGRGATRRISLIHVDEMVPQHARGIRGAAVVRWLTPATAVHSQLLRAESPVRRKTMCPRGETGPRIVSGAPDSTVNQRQITYKAGTALRISCTKARLFVAVLEFIRTTSVAIFSTTAFII